MRYVITIIAIGLILSGCNENKKGTIPFLGLNSKGNVIRHFISNHTTKEMAFLLAKTNEEIIEGLDEVSLRHQNLWNLSRVTVGLELEAGVDVMKTIKFESSGAFELRFEPIAKN